MREKMLRDFVVYDIETTGLSAASEEIIEIAAVKIINEKEVDTFEILVKPSKRVSPLITNITGITNELLDEKGVPLDEAITKFHEFLGENVVFGHNVRSFDNKFMDKAYRKCLNKPFLNKSIDTLYLFRKLIKNIANHKLQTVMLHFGIDKAQDHRALSDCYVLLECINNLWDENSCVEYINHELIKQGY